jgi:outer membrane biosynthesis protein TonB
LSLAIFGEGFIMKTVILSFVLFFTPSVPPNCEEIPQGMIESHFIGGNYNFYNVFKSKIIYPQRLKEENILGSVYYELLIDTIGYIKNVKIIKSPHPLFSEEVTAKIKLTNGLWKPYYIDGKKSKYYIRETVYFELR